MAAHRYWRVQINTGTQSLCALQGLTMATSNGGSTVLGSGTATAQTAQGSPHDAPGALAGTGVYWGSTAAAAQWWEYDFGLGNAFDIQEVTMTSAGGINIYLPTSWTLQFSDNNATWTDVQTFTPALWIDGQIQIFQVTPSTNKRFWRIQCDTGTQGGTYALTEVAMALSVGGSNVIGSGTPEASSQQAPSGNLSAAAAVDGNLSTFWGSNTTPTPTWWQYDFGSGADEAIIEVKITAGSGVEQYHPTKFTLKYSPDNVNFTTAQQFTPATWVASVPQFFDLPTPPSPGAQNFMNFGLI